MASLGCKGGRCYAIWNEQRNRRAVTVVQLLRFGCSRGVVSDYGRQNRAVGLGLVRDHLRLRARGGLKQRTQPSHLGYEGWHVLAGVGDKDGIFRAALRSLLTVSVA